jgi:hypothetical protein
MGNNIQSMKLYTESEVRKAIELSRDTHQEGRAYMERDEYDYSMDEVFDLLTPIELPSHEEIKDASIKYYVNKSACFYFEIGAKWMRDKIGGNK